MEFAKLAATRSTCIKRSVGAVLVRDSMIISTGYNGSPKGSIHCAVIGCVRIDVPSGQRHELCRGTHAEQNAIIQAACVGSSVRGSILYCTLRPCSICMKMIINSEIREVVYDEYYEDALSDSLASDSGVNLTQIKKRNLNHFNSDVQSKTE